MYPYHNEVKRRIRNGELEGVEFMMDYPGVGECMVLYFNTIPSQRPIRPHRYCEYVDLVVTALRKKMQQEAGERG